MAKDYRKNTNWSRTRDPKQSQGHAAVHETAVQLTLPIAEILAGVEDSLESLAGQAGVLMIRALLDDEVDHKVGSRYAHVPQRAAFRHGHEDGFVVFAGRKVPLPRPRVRAVDGREVPLDRYGMFQAAGRMQEAVARRVVRGVSTRNYAGALDAVCDGYGIERSSISRHWQAASAKQLKGLMERPLGDLDLVALMLDGIEFHETLVVAALGFSADGRKHVLGLWQGATENTTVCTTLLDDLVERGLRTDQSYLFVLDGSKALRKAVQRVFGTRAVVQRCVVHKERNVLSYLPEEYHGTVRQRLRAAWGMTEHAKANAALLKLVDYIGELSVSAQRSLEEGLDETLTLHRLNIPHRLRRSLRTTNAIENCFSSTRHLCRNVKKWNGDAMAARWAGAMLFAAQSKFRRVTAFHEMPFLLAALGRGVATQEAVA
jgi:transposase-like protein